MPSREETHVTVVLPTGFQDMEKLTILSVTQDVMVIKMNIAEETTEMLSTTLAVKTPKHPLSTLTQTYWLTMLCWDITEITNILDATLTMMSMIFTLP